MNQCLEWARSDLKIYLSRTILDGRDTTFRISTLISNDLKTMGLVSPVLLIWLAIVIISSGHR